MRVSLLESSSGRDDYPRYSQWGKKTDVLHLTADITIPSVLLWLSLSVFLFCESKHKPLFFQPLTEYPERAADWRRQLFTAFIARLPLHGSTPSVPPCFVASLWRVFRCCLSCQSSFEWLEMSQITLTPTHKDTVFFFCCLLLSPCMFLWQPAHIFPQADAHTDRSVIRLKEGFPGAACCLMVSCEAYVAIMDRQSLMIDNCWCPYAVNGAIRFHCIVTTGKMLHSRVKLLSAALYQDWYQHKATMQ